MRTVFQSTIARLLFPLFLICLLVTFCNDKKPTPPDGEVEWAPRNGGLENLYIQYLAIHPDQSDIVFAGTWDGLYKSIDGAQSWTRLDSGWQQTYVKAIAFEAVDKDIIYVGTHGGGLFKSQDGGESWQSKNRGLVDLTIYGLVTHPIRPDTLFVGCDSGINRSYVGADSLTKVYWFGRSFLAINPLNPQRVYAGGVTNNIHMSASGGDNWAQSSNGIPRGSTDRRIQWVLIDPENPNVIYVASNSVGVYKSVDAGSWWYEKNAGLSTAKDVRALAFKYGDSGHLFAATKNGIYQSTDAGENWQSMSNGLTNLDVRALDVVPASSGIIYAGTWGDGVFVWEEK